MFAILALTFLFARITTTPTIPVKIPEAFGRTRVQEGVIQFVQLRMKPPKCGDHLQGTAAMPLPQIPLEFQILYEEDSGNDCFQQGNNAQACDHYRRALEMLNSEYPYQADIRATVQAIVRRCN